jgi:flagellar biosynthesis/type III secretory pathway protein FliH
LHLIDRLEEMVAEAKKAPLSSSVMLDRARVYDLIDQMRVAVPSQVFEASEVVEGRDAALASAQAEANRIIEDARRRAESELANDPALKDAQARADEILRRADEDAERRRQEGEDEATRRIAEAARSASYQLEEADKYALELMRKLEQQLGSYVENVRNSISQLEDKQIEPGEPAP